MGTAAVQHMAFDATAEAAYGTAAAVPDKRWPFRGERPVMNVRSVDDADAVTGLVEEGMNDSAVAGLSSSQSLEYDMRMDPLAFWLKYALGTLATSGTGPYVHTATVNQTELPSFTGYWKDHKTVTGKYERFVGCKVRRFVIRGNGGGKTTFSVEWIGSGIRTEETVADVALSSPTELIIPFAGISVFSIGGTDYKANLVDFEISIENVFDEGNEYSAGSTTLQSLDRLKVKVGGRFGLKFEQNGLLTPLADSVAQTQRAIVLTLTTATHSVTFNIYNARFDTSPVNGMKPKISLPFRAIYDSASSKTMQAAVTNATVAYT